MPARKAPAQATELSQASTEVEAPSNDPDVASLMQQIAAQQDEIQRRQAELDADREAFDRERLEFTAERAPRERLAGGRDRVMDDSSVKERPAINQYKPPAMLETPADDGYEYHYRYVAEAVNGFASPRNVSMKIREGYERVAIDSLPEDFLIHVDPDMRGDNFARNGDLVLMRIPIEAYKQRQEYYRKRSQATLESVDELQGIAGRDAVREDRGSRTLTGVDAGRALGVTR